MLEPAPTVSAGQIAGPDLQVTLDTQARFRVVAWPRYDSEDELLLLFGRFGGVLAERDDACLCLIYDRASDLPLGQAVEAVENARARALGADTAIDMLLVDDLPGAHSWPALGREVSWALRLPSSEQAERSDCLNELGVPVLESLGELRSRIESGDARPEPGVIPSFCDALDCERPTMFLLGGEPGHGKSSFAVALFRQLAPAKHLRATTRPVSTRCTLVTTDLLYVEFIQARYPEKIPSYWTPQDNDRISEHYLDQISDAEREEFRVFALERIGFAVRHSRREIIIEGWHVSLLKSDLLQVFSTSVNPIEIEVQRNTIRIGDDYLVDAGVSPLIGESAESRSVRIQDSWRRVTARLLSTIRRHQLQQLLSRTSYQCYDDLGQPANNSNSPAKLQALNLPSLDGLRALDIGCNAGYFSIKMRQMGASYVKGIDTVDRDIRLARRYRDLIYGLDRIDFETIDIFELEEQPTFDVIVAISVFHYFRERQSEFLARMHRLLAPGGLLVLEAGISALEPQRPFVEHAARSVDGDNPCHFPNPLALEQMASGFSLEYRQPSVQQPGDRIARFVHHLRRI